jgi:hypothetical protein
MIRQKSGVLNGAGQEEGRLIKAIVSKREAVQKTFAWLKNQPFIKNFSVELILQKILLRAKIIIMKLENKVSLWITELRNRSRQKERDGESYKNGHYWKDLGSGVKEKMSQFKRKKSEAAEKKSADELMPPR